MCLHLEAKRLPHINPSPGFCWHHDECKVCSEWSGVRHILQYYVYIHFGDTVKIKIITTRRTKINFTYFKQFCKAIGAKLKILSFMQSAILIKFRLAKKHKAREDILWWMKNMSIFWIPYNNLNWNSHMLRSRAIR